MARSTRPAAALGLLGCGALSLLTSVVAHADGATPARAEALERVFADDAFWYRPLPDETPVAADSDAIVADLVRQAETHYGSVGNPNLTINTEDYAPTVITAGPDDPVEDVSYVNCQGKAPDDLYVHELFLAQDAPLRDVRIPADAVPAGGSDAEMVVVDPQADRVVELWRADPSGSGWSACWGGVLEPASESTGIFEPPFGVTAAGLSMLGGTVLAEELAAGEIDHVVGIALPFTAPPPVVSAPATRTDGVNPRGWAVPAQGQMLRLPADLDLDSLILAPAARALAEAAQNHGLIVWDTAGAVSFRAENPRGMDADPYREIFRGRRADQELAGDPARGEDPFPLDRLEVLPTDYEAPVPSEEPASSAPTPPPIAESESESEEPGGSAAVVLVAGLLGLVAVALVVRELRRG